MENTKMTERELLDSFDDAMKNGHIYVVYQPKMNHSTGRMIGAEALVRWRDPVHGIQYPSDFIPVLEESRKICEADLHVFETVCRFQRKCLDMGISGSARKWEQRLKPLGVGAFQRWNLLVLPI